MKKQVDTLTQLFHEALKPHKQRMKNRSILAQKSYKSMGKKPCRFSMLIQHHDLDDLETDILDLNNLLKEKEFKEYKRTCEAGIIELDHIYNSEIPSVGNVF